MKAVRFEQVLPEVPELEMVAYFTTQAVPSGDYVPADIARKLLKACEALLPFVEDEWGWNLTPNDALGEPDGNNAASAIILGRRAIAAAREGEQS